MAGVKTNERPGVRASLSNFGMSASKARVVLNLIRGEDVNTARDILSGTSREAADVIGKVNQEIQKSLQAKDVRDRLQSLGLTPAGGTPAQLGQLLSSDIRRWGEVVKRTGASAD